MTSPYNPDNPSNSSNPNNPNYPTTSNNPINPTIRRMVHGAQSLCLQGFGYSVTLSIYHLEEALLQFENVSIGTKRGGWIRAYASDGGGGGRGRGGEDETKGKYQGSYSGVEEEEDAEANDKKCSVHSSGPEVNKQKEKQVYTFSLLHLESYLTPWCHVAR